VAGVSSDGSGHLHARRHGSAVARGCVASLIGMVKMFLGGGTLLARYWMNGQFSLSGFDIERISDREMLKPENLNTYDRPSFNGFEVATRDLKKWPLASIYFL
jgi:hypothetical protein